MQVASGKTQPEIDSQQFVRVMFSGQDPEVLLPRQDVIDLGGEAQLKDIEAGWPLQLVHLDSRSRTKHD